MLERARRLDTLVRLARDLGNRPGNDLNPTSFADEITAMFKGSPVRVTVMGRKELEKDGLRGIVAVGQGSQHEPRLVRLEYRAKKPRACRGAASARASPSTPAASRSSRPPTWRT